MDWVVLCCGSLYSLAKRLSSSERIWSSLSFFVLEAIDVPRELPRFGIRELSYDSSLLKCTYFDFLPPSCFMVEGRPCCCWSLLRASRPGSVRSFCITVYWMICIWSLTSSCCLDSSRCFWLLFTVFWPAPSPSSASSASLFPAALDGFYYSRASLVFNSSFFLSFRRELCYAFFSFSAFFCDCFCLTCCLASFFLASFSRRLVLQADGG